MAKTQEYRFIIDAFSPLTLPMARLAEYLADLAELFAHKSHVHFIGVDKGSANLLQVVDANAVSGVDRRLLMIETRSAKGGLRRAFDDLNDKLYEDNAVGELVSPSGKVIKFSGRERDLDKTAGPISEVTTIDGEVIQIGGRDETISIYLRDRDKIHICTASREQGRILAAYLFQGKVRLTGTGIYIRNGFGEWERRRFVMDSFVPLDTEPLGAVISQLRGLGGPLAEPISFLEELRHGE
jgi:hypothetical protein